MAAQIRIYTDEHISKAVIKGLRNRGIDVLTCKDAGLLAASDSAHLDFAFHEGRVILTKDTDFLKLHTKGLKHAGILYIKPKTVIGQIIQKLLYITTILDSNQMTGHVEFI